MNSGDEFSFVNDLEMPSKDFSGAQSKMFSELGLTPEDIDALGRAQCFCTGQTERNYLLQAMVHYRLRRESILPGLNYCLDEVIGRDYPQTVGADSIFGKARCDVRGFEIGNLFRPFYARILAAKRPEDTERIVINESWADFLRLAQWAPITTGEDS